MLLLEFLGLRNLESHAGTAAGEDGSRPAEHAVESSTITQLLALLLLHQEEGALDATKLEKPGAHAEELKLWQRLTLAAGAPP